MIRVYLIGIAAVLMLEIGRDLATLFRSLGETLHVSRLVIACLSLCLSWVLLAVTVALMMPIGTWRVR